MTPNSSNPYGLAHLLAQGDAVTLLVALTLLTMSIASWVVIVLGYLRLRSCKTVEQKLPQFWSSATLDEGIEVFGSTEFNLLKHIAIEGQKAKNFHENNRSSLQGEISLTDWLKESLDGAQDECAERLRAGLSLLASIGSTAPFVGLLGTVWGIYHALLGLSEMGQSSLDKVAGPVGEALVMTALGLAVAIPAVLGYNALNRGNSRFLGKLKHFSRQLHSWFLTSQKGS